MVDRRHVRRRQALDGKNRLGIMIPGVDNSADSDRRVYAATELPTEWREALSLVKNNPPANLPEDDIEPPAPVSRGWRL